MISFAVENLLTSKGYIIQESVGRNCLKVLDGNEILFAKFYLSEFYTPEYYSRMHQMIEKFSHLLHVLPILPIDQFSDGRVQISIFKEIDSIEWSYDDSDVLNNVASFLAKMHRSAFGFQNNPVYYQHRLRTEEEALQKYVRLMDAIGLSNIDQMSKELILTGLKSHYEIMASEGDTEITPDSSDYIVLHGDYLKQNLLLGTEDQQLYPIDWDCIAYGPGYHEVIRVLDKDMRFDVTKPLKTFVEIYADGIRSFDKNRFLSVSEVYKTNKLRNFNEYPTTLTIENIDKWVEASKEVFDFYTGYKRCIEIVL